MTVTSATSRRICSDADPIRFLQTSIAASEISRAGMFSVREKIVGQRGFASARINDCRGSADGRSFDEREGRFKVGALPAHLSGILSA